MAILHGSWITHETGGYLFIWGEIWRPLASLPSTTVEQTLVHPLAMTQAELMAHLSSHNLAIEQFLTKSWDITLQSRQGGVANLSQCWLAQGIALPTQSSSGSAIAIPVFSTNMSLPQTDTASLKLQLWQVEGFCLDHQAAVKFIQALPLGSFPGTDSYLGSDLRFWTQVYRWSLDLLNRSKFLPGLYRQADGLGLGRWQPLLDSAVDRSRLEKFTQFMPLVCRSYQQMGRINQELDNQKAIADALISPSALLLSFLSSILDIQVRQWVASLAAPTVETPIPEWLRSLTSSSDTLALAPTAIARLDQALQTWTLPVQQHLVTPNCQGLAQNLFRTCLILQPPESGDVNWRLDYYLQAIDHPDFLVDAKTIWRQPLTKLNYQGRTIELPQETFLQGLGLAARIYAPIASSLHQRCPHFCELTPVDVYEFIKASAWRLQDSGLGIIMPPSLAPGADTQRLGISISAEVLSNKKPERLGLQSLLKFKWELAIGEQTISQSEFERLMALKSPLVEVNGEWIALQPADVRAAQAMFVATEDQMTLRVEDALRLSSGDTTTPLKLPVVHFQASGVLEELITALTSNQSIQLIETPASFHGTLRPYQIRGVSWLAFLERWGMGACLADDMGLGKTIQLIAFLLHLKEQNALTSPILLVCPTSVLGNWEREVRKFGPTLKTIVHHGDKRAKGKSLIKVVKSQDLVITSYPLVYRDASTLQEVSWQGVVLDEAQNIKNPSAKQSQAVRQLTAEFRMALTGTPVENRLSELWSILDFLNPAYLGNQQFFQRRFAIPIEKFGDTDSLKTLRSLVQPFILRRLKTDKAIIQDLPEKQEMNVFCGLSAEQATLYQKLVDESMVEIEATDGIKRRGLILTLLLRLKQVCNHPAHLLKEKELKESKRSGKLLRLQEMLEEAIFEGDRALIFTQFAEWGKLLQPYLAKQLRWETLFLYGATKKQQREEMVDRFQNDPEGPRILILSLKAGGTGLNLTRANHVFHVDRWWNPAVENQATDRAFRIGQTRNVQVHKFVCTGTLEERINDIIESKKQLAEQTVDTGEDWITEMDTNQLRSLLLLDRNAVIDED